MPEPSIEIGDHRRVASMAIETRLLNTEARTVNAAVSSVTPVDRGNYIEILDHRPQAIDLNRAAKGLSLIFGHDQSKPIGLADQFSTDGKTLRCRLTFGRSTAADEAWKDVVAGTLKHLSIGYQVLDSKRNANGEVLVTSWEPFEISLVTVPADPNVGIGRSLSSKGIIMENTQASTPQDFAGERARVAGIMALGRRHNMGEQAESAIREGATLDQFRASVLDSMVGKQQPIGGISWDDVSARDAKIVAEFSLGRAISAAITGDWAGAGLEREVSAEIARRSGKSASGMWIPSSALATRTTMTTSSTSSVVGTDHLDGMFINSLTNQAQVLALGATQLSGLNQNVSIPRQTASVSAGWYAENSAISESNATFDSVSMTPKQLAARASYSKRLLTQGLPSIEDLLRADLAKQLALGIDWAAINGLGSANQPRGILNVSGIGSVVGGTNGAAPTWSHIIDLESQLATANADVGSLAYITNAKVRGKLKQTDKASGAAQFVWQDGANDGFGRLNGYRAAVSNQVPSTLTKGSASGVCSAIIFGNWSDLMVGMWGQIDLTVDPYTLADSANVRVHALAFCDIATRHPESFAAMVDVLT